MKSISRLRTKLFVVILPILSVTFLVIFSVNYLTFRALHDEYQTLLYDRSYAIASDIQSVVNKQLRFIPLDELPWIETYLYGVLQRNENYRYCFIANTAQEILYHSDSTQMGSHLEPSLYADVDYNGTAIDRTMLAAGENYELLLPILQADEMVGTIHLGINKKHIDAIISDMIIRTVVVLVVSLAGAIMLLFLLLQQHIVQPVSRLTESAAQLQAGNLDVFVQMERADELGQLGRVFNAMAVRLKDLVGNLEYKVAERTQRLEAQTAELLKAKEDAETAQRASEAAQQAAEAANRAKSDFLANVSHELRTPLTGILGHAQNLTHNPGITGEQQRKLGMIERSGTHLLQLINQILEFSTLEARQVTLHPSDVSLPKLLSQINTTMRFRAHQKGLTFSFLPSQAVPTKIHTDRERLQEVLLQLLNNAVKFTEQGGVTLTVTSEKCPERVEGKNAGDEGRGDAAHSSLVTLHFSVSDTGIGIPEDRIEEIFSPFAQVSEYVHKTEGLGIGLAVSRQLIRMMGGDLHVESREGQGTTCWFEIAVPEAPECSDAPMSPAEYHAVEEEAGVGQNEPPLVAPPPADLDALFELAEIGDFAEIHAHLDRLTQTDQHFMSFVRKLREFANTFQDKEMREFLEHFRGNIG